MNSKTAIVFAVQFILACSSLNRQAAAHDHDQVTEQLLDINRALTRESLNHRHVSRTKVRQHAVPQNQGRTPGTHQHGNLLQELLPPGMPWHESTQPVNGTGRAQGIVHDGSGPEGGLLEELLAGTEIP
jgi:hypothetical protein